MLVEANTPCMPSSSLSAVMSSTTNFSAAKLLTSSIDVNAVALFAEAKYLFMIALL